MNLHEVVVLNVDLPTVGLTSGTSGVVVHIFTSPEHAYEVEFTDSQGRTHTTVVLRDDMVRPYRMRREETVVRLMADYECFPLWTDGRSVPANLDPQRLPISADLAERLMHWAKTYDRTLNRSDPIASGFRTPHEEDGSADKANS